MMNFKELRKHAYYHDHSGILLHGDCLEWIKKIDDKSIDLTVTSPPYDDLRTYKNDIDKTWGDHKWKPLFKELYRTIKDGGMLVWIVGDTTKKFCESLSSFRQAIYAVEECKFNLLDTMIYHKSNYAPAYPTLRRYANTFEYMFIFSKGKPKTFNPVQRDKVVKNYKGKRSWFRQQDGSQILKVIDNDRETKDAENVWTICPTKSKDAGNHPAVFPESLAEDHIKSWSNPGDIVFDPFTGSGTTWKMAKSLGRRFIGIELFDEYCQISKDRIVNHIERATQ
jgi:site-specific DNA-methyltransferase (adenine-specific)